MAKIKYSKTEEKELIVPNCFCGAEPEVYEENKTVGYSYDYLTIYIRCPYCHATQMVQVKLSPSQEQSVLSWKFKIG